MFRPVLALTAATALTATTALTLFTTGPEPALADGPADAITHDKVVSDNPVGSTPHVLDGQVQAVERVGDTMVLGGEFTLVASPDQSQQYQRTNLVAFDAETGEIDPDFAPSTDAKVTALQAAEDGASVYVGGMFDTVNGNASRGVARLDLATGQATEGFTTPELNGRVKDLVLRDQKLWIAGTFGYVAGQERPALATLNPSTGELDDFARAAFADPYRGGVLQVTNIEIDAEGDTLVAAGNFGSVDGQPRPQVAVLKIGADHSVLSDWHTDFYAENCARDYESYLRGVTIDPAGEYVAFSTTGAWKGADTPCDTVARFELDETAELEPTWVNHSGGDTFYAIAATGTAIYAGGHFRWQNNPNTPTGDDPGPGALERSGLAALDPENGVPYSWNPGRTLGVGVFDMLPTEDGLWVTSDTDRVGNWEFHGRVAKFPLDGGITPPASTPPSLPGEVHTRAVLAEGERSNGKPQPLNTDPFAEAKNEAERDLTRVLRPYDGEAFSTELGAAPGEVDWSEVRGAFTLGNQLYLAREDQPLAGQSFDGASYGEARALDASDQLVADEDWQRELDRATGAVGADGRIYYTLEDESALFYRGLNLQSGAVGAARERADTDGVDFSRATGMFVTDEHLYWGSAADGELRRAEFADGRLDAGSVEVVSGPNQDGMRWDSPATFLLDAESSGHFDQLPTDQKQTPTGKQTGSGKNKVAGNATGAGE